MKRYLGYLPLIISILAVIQPMWQVLTVDIGNINTAVWIIGMLGWLIAIISWAAIVLSGLDYASKK